jgi:pimeloyl-ACP methyl ester carboxylesterase
VVSAIGLAATTVSAQATPTSSTTAAARSKPDDGRPPAGFSEHKVAGIDYVIGGHGPTLVLLHGYPQTWYEWHGILPALAEHYTVIAPSLPGAGRSDAPAAGYDKKSMAAAIHTMLVKTGHDRDIRLVGHDIGTMVAYSYAAANPRDVVKLVLSEAPIPDPSVYQFPSLTAQGPGVWNFGFFSLTNGLPEEVVAGREEQWVGKFIDSIEVHKGAVTPGDIAVFADALKDPAHLAASFKWFRAFPQDIKDDAVYQQTPLTMPVLAIGASGSLRGLVADQVRQYATNVTGIVVPDSGHWIYEEHPAEMTQILLDFLKSKS